MDCNTPSGLLDGGSLGPDSFNKEHYSLCDMSDEEVHYSREPVAASTSNTSQGKYPGNSYHYYNPYQATTYQYYHLDGDSTLGSGNFQDLSLNSHSGSAHAADRVKSSKLLQSIGSKLKRGSTFLAAPKLLGQYLLGITIQSWSEFLNLNRLSRAPCNRHIWTRRLVNNLNHFQGNYLCLSLILGLYCILTTPLLLLALVAYLAALYLVTARSATGRYIVIAGGFRPNLRQQYSFITLVTLPLLWVAGAPSAVFWVIGASFVVVGVHASLYCEGTVDQQAPVSTQVIATVGQRNLKQVQQVADSQSVTNHYLPLPGRTSLSAAELATSNQQQQPQLQPGRKQSLGYSSTITQWILSGGKQKGSNQQQEVRVPEVITISQDYAGLGRVYEV